MENKKNLEEVKQHIEKFRNMFKENPITEIKNGTWFTKVLQLVLTEHSQNLNAEHFKKKYIGLDNERIALQLVKTSSNYAAIAGGVAAVTASAAELSTLATGGWSIAALGATLIGEISYITYMQLKMLYDISIILDARLDKDDPEDVLTIFWYALGVNIWEEVSNLVLKAGPRSANYLGRKALRSGIRKGIQAVVSKVGGKKLAAKITEKSLLKLIVPGVNVPLAALINKIFTNKLGEKAIKSFKNRGAVIRTIDKLKNHERYHQLITIPIIYHIGIFDEPKTGLCQTIEMQSNVTRRIGIRDEEERIIEDIISLEYNEFISLLDEYKNNNEIAQILFDVAVFSYLLSNSKNQNKLELLANSIGIYFNSSMLEKYKKQLS